MEGVDQLTFIAIAALIAVICGAIMTRLRQPAVVGYILAGVVLGPSGIALITDRDAISVFAQLGVLLLLFIIGMELSLRGFRGVWRPATVVTVLQIAGSVGITLLLAQFYGWSIGFAVLVGFVVALSSTAVVIKMLEGMNILRTPVAQITIGVLIAQDLAFIPMLLVAQAFAGGTLDYFGLVKVVFAIVFLGLLIMYLSRRKKIRLPLAQVTAGNVDLTPLRGLVFCFGAAALTGLAGLSPAYGAFLSGLVIGNSTERPAMVRTIRPIQSILIMMFFLSIGLLIDLDFVYENIVVILMVLSIVVIAKTAFNIGFLRLAGQPLAHAVITGILLAQIGEFSFVLGQTGVEHGLISQSEGSLIITITALSLLISPLWLFAARRLMRITIIGVTSGRETLRLFFGRISPVIFRMGRAWETYDTLADSHPQRAAEEATDQEDMLQQPAMLTERPEKPEASPPVNAPPDERPPEERPPGEAPAEKSEAGNAGGGKTAPANSGGGGHA